MNVAESCCDDASFAQRPLQQSDRPTQRRASLRTMTSPRPPSLALRSCCLCCATILTVACAARSTEHAEQRREGHGAADALDGESTGDLPQAGADGPPLRTPALSDFAQNVDAARVAWLLEGVMPRRTGPPLLAALGEGVVVAGTTQQPEAWDLPAFEEDERAITFVARMDHRGQLSWSEPVPSAGVPWALKIDPVDEIVLAAPLIVSSPFLEGTAGRTFYIVRFDATGERVRDIEAELMDGYIGVANALALPEGENAPCSRRKRGAST